MPPLKVDLSFKTQISFFYDFCERLVETRNALSVRSSEEGLFDEKMGFATHPHAHDRFYLTTLK